MSVRHIGFYTATAIVIANMIGTGVFTSLGFQAAGLHSVFSLLLIWLIGGIAAFCGALSYGELGAAMPRSGGEYHYLSKIFHPAVGFLSGWVSATVGFAAPVALAAIAMGNYTSRIFPAMNSVLLASSVVVILTVIHSTDIRMGSGFQVVFTTLKILLILFFIFSGFFASHPQDITLLPVAGSLNEIFSPAFAVSLFFVSYSYSGWNASAYLAGEMDNPQKNLPKSLLQGTLAVMLLYMFLNFIFLYTAPIPELAGQLEVGFISASKIFGLTGGNIIGVIISLLLISSVSSMIIAGPRVLQVMGEDFRLLQWFARKTKKGIPAIAIMVQSAVSLLLILTSTFEQVIMYIGFTLNLFTFLSVLGLIVLRIKNPKLPRPYKTWGYPFTPVIFLSIGLWVLVYGLMYMPYESIAGFATVLTGLIVYFLDGKIKWTAQKHS